MNRYMKFSGSLVVASLLAGCGGGGSDSSAPTNLDTTIDGKAVDGYLRYSTVCLDISGDGYCQSIEPMAQTEEDGSFKLTVTAEQKAMSGYDKAKLIVYGGQDSDTGKDFIGKLKAPNDGTTVNVTPLTTLVAEIIADSNDKAEIDAAKAQVAKVFGLTDASKVSADPIALAATDSSVLSAALQVQKAIEKIVESAGTNTTASEKQTMTKDIYSTLATEFKTINTTTSTTTLSDIITTKQAVIIADVNRTANVVLDTNKLAQAKEVAEVVKTTIVGSLTADTIATKAQTIDYAKENNTSASAISTISNDTILINGVKNLFSTLAIEWNDDYNTSAANGTFKANMTLDQLNTAAGTSYPAITSAIADKKAALEFATNTAYLTKAELDAMFVSSALKAGATETEAKNMIKNLRELAYSLYDEERQTGLIVDQQSLMIKAVETSTNNAKTQIKATSQNVSNLIVSMGDEMSVLDEVAQAMVTAVEAKVSETKTSDTITVSGTGYSFKVTYSVVESGTTFSINGNADVSIEKDGTKFTGKLIIDGKDDDAKSDFQGLEKLVASFDGTIATKEGRSFTGKISLDTTTGTHFLEGSLAGKTTEPSINGKFTLNAKLLDLQKINEDGKIYGTWGNGLNDEYLQNFPPIIKDGTSYSFNTTGISSGEYNLDDYVFPIRIEGTKEYISSLDLYKGDMYFHTTNEAYKIEDGNAFQMDWEHNTETPVTIVALAPEPKVEFDTIPKSYTFSGSVKDTELEASFDMYANIIAGGELSEATLKSLKYKDNKLDINVDTFSFKELANTTTFKIGNLSLSDRANMSLTLKGEGSDTEGTSSTVGSGSEDFEFAYSYADASLSGKLVATYTSNSCGDDADAKINFVGKISANDFVPFNIFIEADQKIANETVTNNAAVLINRNGYKFAIKDAMTEGYSTSTCSHNGNTQHTISGVDSKGVKFNTTDPKVVVFKNASDTTLGTLTNGTVTYSDNSFESAF